MFRFRASAGSCGYQQQITDAAAAFRAGPPEIFAALLGIVLTAIYLDGLLEREDRTIFGMGYDSLAVACIYLAGIILLYFVR